jgi:hypothetical protein
LPSVAAKNRVYGSWQEADIGSRISAVASMTGIEVATVIQRGRPQITSSNFGRTSAARRVEITLSTHSSHPQH